MDKNKNNNEENINNKNELNEEKEEMFVKENINDKESENNSDEKENQTHDAKSIENNEDDEDLQPEILNLDDVENPREYFENKHKQKEVVFSKSKNTVGIILTVCGLCLCFGMAVYLPLLSRDNKSTSIKTTTPKEPAEIVTTDSKIILTDVSSIVEEIKPALVSVTTKVTYQNPYAGFFGGDPTFEQEGAGSGVIIGKNEKELLIVTNNHVIANSNAVKIRFVDDKEVAATVKATDKSNDIALLSVNISKIDEETINAIKIITMGNSEDLKVGQGAIAAGNALGYGLTVTSGIISATDREVTDANNGVKTYIQTDAAINPGNSGGALVNYKGELIGINVAKLADTEIEGIGFAIPISSIKKSIEDMSNEETREPVAENERGYLGVSVEDIDAKLSQQYNIPQGVRVAAVTNNNAKKAGLKENDIIVGIGNKNITSFDELKTELSTHKAGETVTLKVKRTTEKGYKDINVKIKLLAKSELADSNKVDDEKKPIFH